MANVTGQSTAVYSDGVCDKTVLYSVKNTTAGDTVDVSSMFSAVKRAGLVGATTTTIAAVSTVATGANGGPTLLTIPAGPSGDGIWLLVYGVST
jgi:hypothetical protein